MHLILQFLTFTIILLSYSMLVWMMYEVYDSFKWWILFGLFYAMINIYFIITFMKWIYQNDQQGENNQSKLTNLDNLIVKLRWDQVKLIAKSINLWADKNKIKDAMIRLFTVASFITLYLFIRGNSAIWSYALAWTFELFLIVYRYKIGRVLSLFITMLILSPLLLAILFCILWYNIFFDEFLYDKRKRITPSETIQLYNLESHQARK